jgi:hypothetical protein
VSARRVLAASLRSPLLPAAALLVMLFAWTASEGLPFGFGAAQDGLYNLLTQALEKKQLHLLIEPAPGLFELSDPYEPARNASTRLHDASLFHGHYYVYFGIVPVVAAFLPWRLAGLGDLPEPAAAVAFAVVAFVFAALLLGRLLEAHLGPTSYGRRLCALLALGSASGLPFILRGAYVYEVAIAAGACFSMAAAYLFVCSADAPSRWPAVGAGLCLGLAVGCRPNLLVLAAVLPFLVWSPRRLESGGGWRKLTAIAAPFATCLFLLGAYNHARFGSSTEFGTRFQLAALRRISWWEPSTVPYTLYYLFLAPPRLSLDFPFVLPDHAWPFGGSPPDGFFLDERTTGALVHAPLLLILLAAGWILPRAGVRQAGLLRLRLSLVAGAGLLLSLATSAAFSSVAMRFEVDFLFLLLVPALVLWLAARAALQGHRYRRVLSATLWLALAWSVLAGLALGVTGARDELRNVNPELFASLERRFEPVRLAAGSLLEPDHLLRLRARIAFPERTTSDAEALLSWGRAEEHDVLWVRATPAGYVFTLDPAAAREHSPAPPPSASLPLTPARFYEVTFELDRLRRAVRATIDGRPAFTLRGTLTALHPNRAWFGRGPKGLGRQFAAFSGTILPEAMWLAGPPGLESLPPILPAPAIVRERRDEEAGATVGQTRLVAGRAGADLFTSSGWRWIPLPFVERAFYSGRISPRADAEWRPLLAWGDTVTTEALLLRGASDRHRRLALAAWTGSWSVDETAASDGGEGRFDVSIDRPGRTLTVDLDGHRVLSSSRELPPLSGARLYVGELPPGVRLEPRVFDATCRP